MNCLLCPTLRVSTNEQTTVYLLLAPRHHFSDWRSKNRHWRSYNESTWAPKEPSSRSAFDPTDGLPQKISAKNRPNLEANFPRSLDPVFQCETAVLEITGDNLQD